MYFNNPLGTHCNSLWSSISRDLTDSGFQSFGMLKIYVAKEKLQSKRLHFHIVWSQIFADHLSQGLKITHFT